VENVDLLSTMILQPTKYLQIVILCNGICPSVQIIFYNLFQSVSVDTETTSLHELKKTKGTSFQNLGKLKLQKGRNGKRQNYSYG